MLLPLLLNNMMASGGGGGGTGGGGTGNSGNSGNAGGGMFRASEADIERRKKILKDDDTFIEIIKKFVECL